MKEHRKKIVFFAILAGLVFLAYANSLNNSFVSDDVAGILRNPQIGVFKSVFDRPYGFIQPLFYYIEYRIGGLNPLFFRLPNILFHIGSVWMVFLLFSVFSDVTLAFIIASIFAIHPILTESVVWISGGPYVRYGFFFFCSFYLYIKSSSNKKLYLLSLLFFVLSLFSSDKAIVIPLLFFLYEFSLGDLKQRWKKLILYFGISGVWVLLYISLFGNRLSGIETQSYSLTKVLNPFIQIPVAITSYLQLMIWPNKLTLYHSEMNFGQFDYAIRLIICIGFIGLMGYGWKKNRPLFFWLTFFIISLLPTLTPFGISWIVAERYVYLGSIGIIFIMSYALTSLIRNKKTETFGYLIFIICILAFMARTIVRNIDWKNEDNLWIATGKTSPSDPKTHNNLGDVYGRQGNLDRSAKEFQIAIQLNPHYADAYHNLGNTYLQMGNKQKALENYYLALKYNPDLWQSYQNIAGIYFEQQKYEEAAVYMKGAIKIVPNNSFLYSNLGVIYLKQGNRSDAKAAFETALKLDPSNQQAKSLLEQK